MADTTQTAAFPLGTVSYSDGGGSSDGSGVDNAGGASGTSSGGINLSHGAMIAIILVVVLVAVFGTASAVLFYLAKKREWKVRQSIRRSARRVVTALTPRRSEFPTSVKDGPRGGRGVRIDDVPPTPRLPKDLEKGLGGRDDSGRSNKSNKPSKTSKAGKSGAKMKLSSIGQK
ncbi:hypothetical protein HMPREF1624_00216 [Sporothrix schenckii ATCC 58251]|uniref:Transmembrane protein n=2 Tax=Sporothrix schenckii TaxID=29908 RepID=U7Q5E1_SPOS1|nr:hypothetical protein HMPREF1624_00216 [Sporothrix schenckii ATCC 58251]